MANPKMEQDVVTGLYWWAVEHPDAAKVAYTAIAEIERNRKIKKEASALYDFLSKVIGEPNDPEALAVIKGEETTAVGIAERLQSLGVALGVVPSPEGNSDG